MSDVLRELSIIYCLFHVLILFMFLYRSRWPRTKTIIMTAVFMLPLIAITTGGIYLYGHEVMAQMFIFTCTLPSLIFFWIMSADRGSSFFFTFCLSDTFSYWIIIITYLLDHYLGGGNCVLLFISRLAAFPIAEWLIWRYLRIPYKNLQQNVKRGWLLAAGLGAIYYLLMLFASSFPVLVADRPGDIPAMILILMPLTYATIFAALYQQLMLYRTRERDRILLLQKEQLENQLESYEATQRLKHDMQAFYTTLAGLVADKKYAEAGTLLAEMNPYRQGKGMEYCADPYVNAVLNQFADKFRDRDCELKIDIQSYVVPIPGIELSLILFNALDNALCALSALSPDKRRASVQLRRRDTYLLLRVRNVCSPSLSIKRGTFPETTKTEPGHGLGLTTIRQASETLGGSAVCYTEGGQFVLDVYVQHRH